MILLRSFMYFYKLERVSIICFVLLVVFTTGENGHFRYEAVSVYILHAQFSDPAKKWHAVSWACQVPCCCSIKIHDNLSDQLSGTEEDKTWLDEQMLLLFVPSGILICQIYFCNYCSLHNCMQWQYDMAAWHTAKATKHKVIKMSRISVYFVEYLCSLRKCLYC